MINNKAKVCYIIDSRNYRQHINNNAAQNYFQATLKRKYEKYVNYP